jgi:hypothetical protein
MRDDLAGAATRATYTVLKALYRDEPFDAGKGNGT